MEGSENKVMLRFKRCFTSTDVSWPTYFLVWLFGLGSWIAVNGLWVELPVLVKHAPESWNLPSYLVVLIQLANVGPLLYSIGNRYAPQAVHEKSTVIGVVSVGGLSCLLLAFYWDKTSFIGGAEHSTALLVLSFCLAIVDCTSSVVFLTFMAIFPSQYLTSLFLGETCSGLLPALVALGQGIGGGNKCPTNSSNTTVIDESSDTNGMRFGPDGFFFFLFVMMAACLLAFLGLNYLSVARKQHVRSLLRNPSQEAIVDSRQNLLPASHGSFSEDSTNAEAICQRSVIYLLCIQAWINCLSNGVLPSIQAYASEPYGEKTYHLVATLSSIGSAVTCFGALWLPNQSSLLVTILAGTYTILSGYVVVLASLSPYPPLYGSTLGSFLIVFVSIVSNMIISYTKLTISTIMRDKGRRALFWCGISIQIGSCIGALTMFPLVDIFKLFHQANRC